MTTDTLLPRLRWYQRALAVLSGAVLLVGVLALRASDEAGNATCVSVNQAKTAIGAVILKAVDIAESPAPEGTPQAVLDLRKKNAKAYRKFYNEIQSKELKHLDC